MLKDNYLLPVIFLVFTAFKTDKPAYLLFDKDGKTVKYEKMLKQIQEADVVLFGESLPYGVLEGAMDECRDSDLLGHEPTDGGD